MKTIIYVHPYDKSFNHAILEEVVKNIDEYRLIDLYKEEFNPAYDEEELSLFNKGETKDPLVKKYQKIIEITDELIIITPIWWNNMPAMLKGFLDKVFKQKFAYENAKIGVIGKLDYIKKVVVITTATSPKFYIKYFAGNCINGSLKTSFKQVGVKNFNWIHFGNIGNSTLEQRQKFLDSIKYKI